MSRRPRPFPPSRRATTATLDSMSLGPSSSLSGTPLTSQWLYFHPGVLSDRASSSQRTPAAFRTETSSPALALRASRSSGVIFALTIGMATSWTGETSGGMTRPLSSPWTMTMTPMERVEMPHEFYFFFFFFREGEAG